MSTTHSTTENRTAIRPAYIPLGVDGNGSHHVYRTLDETVFVVNVSGIEHREDLDRSVDVWMDYVDQERGWTSKQYYTDAGEMLADRIGGGA